MTSRILFCSILFITSSHAMEIIKNNRNQKQHNHLFFEKFLLTKKIGLLSNIPQEINQRITLYRIVLENNDLLNSPKDKNHILIKLCDTHVPLNYYHLLNSTHIELLQKIFQFRQTPWWRQERSYAYIPLQQCSMRQKNNKTREFHYFLESAEDYQLFLTLPIELRKCLTKAPASLIHWSIYQQEKNVDIIIPMTINAFQTIQVRNKFTEIEHQLRTIFSGFGSINNADFGNYMPHPIVPEEKNHKK